MQKTQGTFTAVTVLNRKYWKCGWVRFGELLKAIRRLLLFKISNNMKWPGNVPKSMQVKYFTAYF